MGRISISNNAKGSNAHDPEKQASTDPDDTLLDINVKPADRGQSLTLEQYRALVGLPQKHHSSASPGQTVTGFVKTKHGLISLSSLNHQQSNSDPSSQIRKVTATNDGFGLNGSRFMVASHLFARPATMRGKGKFWRRTKNAMEAEEYATSLYYNLLRLESDQHRLYHFYNVLTYTCLVLQLAIASVLIILGAILGSGSDHRIAIAVLAAATGVLTGVMSLAKGQGYPTRMVQYANRLRQVRDKLEFMERALCANCGAIVTFQDVLNLWNEFEKVRDEKAMNQPDVWTTFQQIEQPLMSLEQKQIGQQFGTQKATGASALPLLKEGATHASGNTTSSNDRTPVQQHPSATTDANTKPTPSRGNTIRISNDGRNKEMHP